MMKVPQRAGTATKYLLLAGCAVLLLSPTPVPAQVSAGTPGSPGATTTIDGKQLPPPDPKFGGAIGQTLKNMRIAVPEPESDAPGG